VVVSSPIKTAAWIGRGDEDMVTSAAAAVVSCMHCPQEVAAARTFLTSPGARYLMRTTLVVDGGLMAHRESSS
jgi:NAD(P)-dependent dehydrogenase (short-subunit alcohol dehydrogenase family)